MRQSDPFTAMAARINHNTESEFGGAFVIYPPDGDPIVQDLSLNPTSDSMRFWLRLKTEIDAVVQQIDEKARRQQAFMR